MTNAIQPKTSTAPLTEQQFIDQIAQVLTVLAHDLGLLMQASAQNQADQASLATTISNTVHEESQKFIQERKDAVEQEHKSHSGFAGFLEKSFGSLSNSVWGKVLMGVLAIAFCETGIGVLMAASTMAIMESPLGQKMTAKLAEAMGGGAAGQIIAGVIITTVLTAGTGAAEGAALGARENVEDEVAEVANNSSKKFHWGASSATVFSTTLMSTNLVYNIALSASGGDEEKALIAAAIVNVALTIAAFGSASKAGASSEGSLLEKMKNALPNALKEKGMMDTLTSLLAFFSLGQSAYKIDAGLNQLDAAQIEDDIAPIIAMLSKLRGFTNINNTNFAQAQNTYRSLTTTKELIFNTDFALGWKAAVEVAV